MQPCIIEMEFNSELYYLCDKYTYDMVSERNTPEENKPMVCAKIAEFYFKSRE